MPRIEVHADKWCPVGRGFIDHGTSTAWCNPYDLELMKIEVGPGTYRDKLTAREHVHYDRRRRAVSRRKDSLRADDSYRMLFAGVNRAT